MRVKFGSLAFLIVLGLVGTAWPAAAQTDTITAPFGNSAGVTTSDVFSGDVHIEVSGTGNAFFSDTSDAFYFISSQTETNSNGDFQLAIGTPDHPFVGEADGQGGATDAIKFDIVSIDGVGAVSPGTIPAYSSANTYGFVIGVPNSTATALTFGVNDGNYSDNNGAFTITVSQVPEPSTVVEVAVGLLGLIAFRLKTRPHRATVSA